MNRDDLRGISTMEIKRLQPMNHYPVICICPREGVYPLLALNKLKSTIVLSEVCWANKDRHPYRHAESGEQPVSVFCKRKDTGGISTVKAPACMKNK
jgi:hypothetical protein